MNTALKLDLPRATYPRIAETPETDKTQEIIDSLRRTRETLREGGPEMQSLLVRKYLSGLLSPAKNDWVEKNVLTYRAWFEMMIRLL